MTGSMVTAGGAIVDVDRWLNDVPPGRGRWWCPCGAHGDVPCGSMIRVLAQHYTDCLMLSEPTSRVHVACPIEAVR